MSRVLVGADARRMLLLPLLRSVRAINASLGPDGRALLYEATPGGVGFASDGLTIAKEIAEADGVGSVGTRLLKETLFSSDRDLGDGAARIACILGAIVEEGTKLIAAGYPPQEFADEILRAGRLVQAGLAAQHCAPPPLLAMARAVSNDEPTAVAVADAVAHAGADGVVDVKEHPRDAVHAETGGGFSIDAALPSQHLGPVPPATILELDDVFVLAANEIVSDFGRLGPILDGFASRKKALAIVARDVAGVALEGLVRNRRELGLHIVALKPTDASARAGQAIEDLAIATGATLIGAEVGRSLDTMTPAMLGRAKRMRFAGGRALFVKPGGDAGAIETRRRWLAAEAEKARYLAYDREHLVRRSARLASLWGEVRVGGRNTFETATRLTEAKATVAVLQAALRSGVVAGGGSALVREAVRLRAGGYKETGSARAAQLCVAQGLEAVVTHIARNAGLEPTAPVAGLRASTGAESGFDARSGRIVDAVAAGIADPLSTTSSVVGRAVSVAATILRVDVMIGG